MVSAAAVEVGTVGTVRSAGAPARTAGAVSGRTVSTVPTVLSVFFMRNVGASAISIMSATAQMTRRSMETQFTVSGNGIDAARMERMAACEPARREPRALEGAVSRD